MEQCGGEISTNTDRRPSSTYVLQGIPTACTPNNPLRVYLPKKDYPGLAMTRSIGDAAVSRYCEDERR